MSSHPRSPRAHILFVDDDEANLLVLQETCRGDFPVLVARGADEALRIMESATIGVLVTDQRMPGTTGVDLLERVREESPDTIRMLVTAYSDLSAAIGAINRGRVRRYLKKPWRADELKSELADALDVFEMRRALRTLQTRLVETERLYALGIVAAGIAHEINNPLQWVGGNLAQVKAGLVAVQEALSGEPRDLGPLRSRLATAVVAVSDAEEGVRRIQDVVRGIELPARASSNDVTDVADVLRLMLRIVRGEVIRTTDLVLDVSPVRNVRGSGTKIGQIVLNLIVNALQALASRPRERNVLKIRLWDDDAWVRLEVEDNGPGIEEVELEKVFDPFYTTREGGTGLGLAISRKIAEELGGRLDVSGKPGQGASFGLRLPALEGSSPPPGDLA